MITARGIGTDDEVLDVGDFPVERFRFLRTEYHESGGEGIGGHRVRRDDRGAQDVALHRRADTRIDRMRVPLPFGKTALTYGKAVYVHSEEDMPRAAEELEKELNEATDKSEMFINKKHFDKTIPPKKKHSSH